ncbi:MAG TPA: hypothetical protein VK066_11135 [Chloroflexota bacterium]|nr:hypothetical protein [Chloroflexota bacterium]
MRRQWLIATFAAAALLTGGLAAGSVPRAQAQGSDCMAEFGTVGTACGELRFNMSPAPDTMPPAPILAGPPPAVAAQPGAADQSQAAPQDEQQPAGME